MKHALLAVIPLLLLSAAARAQERSLLEILSAERFTGYSVGDAEYTELVGGVTLKHGNVLITCNRAIRNLTQSQVELIGNVVITQDTLVLKTDRGMYDEKTRRAWSGSGVYLNDGHVALTADRGEYLANQKLADFVSRISVEDSTSRITANRLLYNRDSARVDAMGNVFIRFKNENAVIHGDSIVHYPDEKISIFPLNPVFWQIDSTDTGYDSTTGEYTSVRIDTLSIVAAYMAAYRDSSDRFITEGNVEIVRGSLSALCGRAEFFRADDVIALEREPILWYDENQITGDSITVELEEQELSRLTVTGDAFSASQSKPSESDTLGPPGRYDQTKGKTITLDVADGKPRRILVERAAISLYYLFDERALNGVRRESGDSIIIDFLDGKADQIHTIGGVEGTYYPEQFVTGKEASFNLDGFLWRTDRPAQPVLPPEAFGSGTD